MQHASIAIQTVMDGLAMETFGMIPKEAELKGVCLKCKELALPKCVSLDDLRNWQTYRLCTECVNKED